MRIKSETLHNMGGGCMVLELIVDSNGPLKAIGITDESIVGYRCSITEDVEDLYDQHLWMAHNEDELKLMFGDGATYQQLIAAYDRYFDRTRLSKDINTYRDFRNVTEKLNKLHAAMLELSEVWNESLDENYPFDESFEEMIDKVSDWKDN